jgi:cellulose synthase (UDP-forming)
MFFGAFNTYFISWNMFIDYKNPIDFKLIKNLPHIEIYLLSCSEPLEILQDSLNKLLSIDYPNDKLSIIVCDDGYSDELFIYTNKIIEENLSLNITYKNRVSIAGYSKAGNVNDTIFNLGKPDSLILILDSDMQCKPEILKTLIPYFYNEKIELIEDMAFVQSPQSFTNIEKWDILGQQYIYFYQIILKSWYFWGCVPCCGTNVLFSKKILVDIGGFQYGSVTEDFLTSMILHSKKYQSIYCNKILAVGLAPFTLNNFYNQRFRWALGGIQLLKFFPIVYSKLSLSKLWIYFNASLFILLTPLLITLVSSI